MLGQLRYLCAAVFLFIVCVMQVSKSYAQKKGSSVSSVDSFAGFDENAVLLKYNQEAFRSTPSYSDFLNREKARFIERKYFGNQIASHSNPSPPVVNISCTNSDFETGDFTGWTGCTGCNPNSSLAVCNSGGVCTTPGFTAEQHVIMSGAATDVCSGVPVVFPGGNYSAKLGTTILTGHFQPDAQAQQLSYSFFVNSANAIFTYNYSVVFEDPGHATADQPYFEVGVYDQNGNVIPCSYYKYIASPAGTNGFLDAPNCAGVRYKPWTAVSIDLSLYVNTTLTVTFSTSDCALGGHYCYAYIDCSCNPIQITQTDTLCDKGTATLFGPVGYAGYAWLPNGETSQNITVSDSGLYSLTVTTLGGCQKILNYHVSKHPLPIPNFTFSSTPCSLIATVSESSTVPVGIITDWFWDFGDGTTSNLQKPPPHTYATPGTKNVKLVVTTDNGCKDSIVKPFSASFAQKTDFAAPPVCLNTPTVFTEVSTAGSATINKWDWNFGEPSSAANTSTNQNPSHTFASAGSFNVKLVTTSTAGCKDSITKSVLVNPLPVADFTAPTVCEGSMTNFSDKSVLVGGTISQWSWNFGEAGSGASNTSTQQNPSHTYAAAGNYNVTLTVTSDQGCVNTKTISVIVEAKPTAAFNVVNACVNAPLQFTDASVSASGTVNAWDWDFGDGSPHATIQNPSHSYTTDGIKTITLIVTTTTGCKNTITLPATVYPLPLPAFSVAPVCLNNPSAFSDQSVINSGTITGWAWNFGEAASGPNNTSVIQSPSHTYATAGSFDVWLTAISNFGCKDSIKKAALVKPLPVADFKAPTVCIGSPVIFSDQSSVSAGLINQWDWDFGEPGSGVNNVSTNQNPSHTYAVAGTFNVSLTVTSDKGCKTIKTITTTVNPQPTAVFTAVNACLHDAISLKDNSISNPGQVTAWDWDFGDGAAHDFTQNPTHVYAVAGTTNVTLIITNSNGCKDTITKPVITYPLPVADFVSPQVCFNLPTAFTDGSNVSAPSTVTGWNWDFGDNTTKGSTKNIVHTYGAPGNYLVTLAITTNYNCSASITKPVTVFPLPTVSFSTAAVCKGVPTIFKDNSNVAPGKIASWLWNFGDGSAVSTLQNPQHTYSNFGTYKITLIVTTDNGCVDSTHQSVLVNPLPQAGFVATDTVGCERHCVTFNDTSTVNPGFISNRYWSFGDGTYSSLKSPSKCYDKPGKYPVTLLVMSDKGCKDSAAQASSVTIYPKPVAGFYTTPTITTILNPKIDFTNTASSDVIKWYWYFGDGDSLNPITPNPSHVYPTDVEGTYTITQRVINQYGCIDSIQHTIVIGPDWTFYIPNAFSPNGDGINDYFNGKGVNILEYKLMIFDRWGNLIFETNSLNIPWNGKANQGADIAQQDVYVWKVVLKDVFFKPHQYIGHVTLVK